MLTAEQENARTTLAARDKEIVVRTAEVERLRADLDQSERLRADLERSYRELLVDVDAHLQRNTSERSQLRERVTAAEEELAQFREEVRRRSTEQQHLESVRGAMSAVAPTIADGRGVVVTIPGMFSRQGSRWVEPALYGVLDRVAEQLRAHPQMRVAIEGHTDNSGSAGENLALSQDRADAVREYLEGRGIDGARITTIGRGEAVPAYDNDRPEGRIANRRVEIVFSFD